MSLRALRAFSGVPPVSPWDHTTALLLVDLQVSCVRPHGHTLTRLREEGLETAAQQYEAQLGTAIPNLRRVLTRARDNRQVVFHTHFVTLPPAVGTSVPRSYRSSPPGSEEAQIIEELSPVAGEYVLPKSCSGVFTGTNLDYLLRKLGIGALIVGGVVTHGCVERAVTEGYDRGYSFILLGDGTASMTNELHQSALERMDQRRAHVVSTDWLLTHDHIQASPLLKRASA